MYKSLSILMLCYVNIKIVVFVKHTKLLKTDHETEKKFLSLQDVIFTPDLILHTKPQTRNSKHST